MKKAPNAPRIKSRLRVPPDDFALRSPGEPVLLGRQDRQPAALATPSGEMDTQPIFGASAVQWIRLSMYNPLRNFGPRRLVTWLEEQEQGYLSGCLRGWEAMARRDDTLATVKGKKEDAVAQRTWSIIESDQARSGRVSQSDVDAQKERRRYFWNNIKCVSAWDRNIRGGFAQFVRLAMHAQVMRYGAIHFVWRPTSRGLTATLEFVPGWLFENLTGELRFLGTNPENVFGTALDPTNWITLSGRGIMEAASVGYAYKHLGFETLGKYCSRFGMPFPLGKTSAVPGSKEWRDMEAAIRGIANDGGAVIGTGGQIDLLQASGGTGMSPQMALIERIDRALSAMFRGGDLSTMSSTKGQGTGSNQQSRESDLIENSDCLWISEIMQEIDEKVDAWYDGEGTEAVVYTHLQGPSLEDADLEMKKDDFAIRNGIRLSIADWCERNNRHEAEPGQPVLGEREQEHAEDDGLAENAGFNPAEMREFGHWAKGGVPGKGSPSIKSPMRKGTWRDLAALGITPTGAYHAPRIATDPNAELIATVKDEKGRTQPFHSQPYKEKQAAIKFDRVGAMHYDFPGLIHQMDEHIAAGGPNLQHAHAARLMAISGFRVGGLNGGGDNPAYGASSIKMPHLRVDGDKIHFNFPGKMNQPQVHTIEDTALARYAESRMGKGRRKGKETLFDVNDRQVAEYVKKLTGGRYTPHDFRRHFATTYADHVAKALIAKGRGPKTPEEYKLFKLEVARHVARRLGNRPETALASYIHPEVFRPALEGIPKRTGIAQIKHIMHSMSRCMGEALKGPQL